MKAFYSSGEVLHYKKDWQDNCIEVDTENFVIRIISLKDLKKIIKSDVNIMESNERKFVRAFNFVNEALHKIATRSYH